MSHHAGDESQWTGVILDWSELVTFGQVSVERDVCGDLLSAVYNVFSLAQAIDGGLK